MKIELEHFYVGQDYGGNQDKLKGFLMRMGGCAAVTACDSCIYMDRTFGTHLYQYKNGETIEEDEYEDLLRKMKPYLRPRMSGVDRLEIYTEGLTQFLHDRKERGIRVSGFDGSNSVSDAAEVICYQIDAGFPIPYLLLRHQDKALEDYIWHWFLVNGYEKTEAGLQVKVTTYGEWRWFDLAYLWETGYERRGGLILLKKVGEKE